MASRPAASGLGLGLVADLTQPPPQLPPPARPATPVSSQIPVQTGMTNTPPTTSAPTQLLINDLDQLNKSNPIAATAEWLKSQSTSHDPTQRGPPTPRDFLVPTSLLEHNQIIACLVGGGSLPAEAEQIIAMRKTALNKALREYKKENQNSQSASSGKKSNRQNKQARSQLTQNAN